MRHKNHNKKVNIAMKALFKRFLSFICKTQNELEPELKPKAEFKFETDIQNIKLPEHCEICSECRVITMSFESVSFCSNCGKEFK
ncbi:hypothetical protein NVP1155O_31 [Vibrio phage 1.155.O._10N.222.55.B3]|nr:hypothetical protein NVP1155O_31 [Vibrio phage 1.155.O._10N.222.55.B3]